MRTVNSKNCRHNRKQCVYLTEEKISITRRAIEQRSKLLDVARMLEMFFRSTEKLISKGEATEPKIRAIKSNENKLLKFV